ncbi:hypothetical protein CASFOL_015456 [Castilleja foliolosa]|uniref:RNase H type-1 domain-containing protein n=1 Tax=Castilleja foliolosa TaxID=1961234 RepID=A0ABD3DEC8_9LAMI
MWRDFLYEAVAGAFGEEVMHPYITGAVQYNWFVVFGLQMVCLRDSTISNGSLATGATYFGVIESTKKWMDKSYPNASGHWAHFISGALGDTLGSVIYVPCEVMKQRMQVQGSNKYWTSVVAREGSRAKHGTHIYGYYSGMFQAGCSIWEEQGLKGLYAGYWSTLARDVPFAGLMVTFYEAFKNVTQYGNHNLFPNSNFRISSFFEGLLLGGLAGGLSAYLTTPLDVIKTRLQVQGTATRYNGWLDALCKVWYTGGIKGMFSGGVPRLMWDLVITISKECKAHWQSMANSSLGSSKPVKDWKPPPSNWISVSVDAAFNKGCAITGLVFRNSNGSVLHAAAHKHNCLDPISAESLAILDACLELKRFNISKAYIESDCINAIAFIQVNSANTFWTVAPMIHKIRTLREIWKDWKFRYIPRKANGAAHALAHWASFCNFVGDNQLNCIPIHVFCDYGYPLVVDSSYPLVVDS